MIKKSKQVLVDPLLEEIVHRLSPQSSPLPNRPDHQEFGPACYIFPLEKATQHFPHKVLASLPLPPTNPSFGVPLPTRSFMMPPPFLQLCCIPSGRVLCNAQCCGMWPVDLIRTQCPAVKATKTFEIRAVPHMRKSGN